MDKELISLLVFGAIALISTWINKKRQERAEQQQQPPSSLGERDATEAPPPRRASSWEEELRRLLEGESPASPPPRREPVPRPVLVPPVLPDRPSPPPVMAGTPEPVRAAPAHPAVTVVPPTAVLLQQAHAQQEEARRALAHAEERVQSALQHSHLSSTVAPVSGAHVRKLLHDRESLRSAFVVSLIFGTPKGLAD